MYIAGTHTNVMPDRIEQIRGLVDQCYAYARGEQQDKPVDPSGHLNIDGMIDAARASIRLVERGTQQVEAWLKNRK